jgi:hypothetical protein
LPPSRASSDGFTVTDFTSTMLAFLEPPALKNFTPVTETVGVGKIESEIGPSIASSRPGRRLHLRDDQRLVGN